MVVGPPALEDDLAPCCLPVGPHALPLPPRELPLVALSVGVGHDSETDLVVLELPVEGLPLPEPVHPVQLLIVLPLALELVAIGVPVPAPAAPPSVFDPPLVKLFL